jgi:hypothetical protein
MGNRYSGSFMKNKHGFGRLIPILISAIFVVAIAPGVQADDQETTGGLLIWPYDGNPSVERPVFFDWNNVSGALEYGLQVDDNSNFNEPEVDWRNIYWSEYRVWDLLEGKKYYWRVRTRFYWGWGVWCEPWGFTTEKPTAVEELEGRRLPSDFQLSQNHPNPFNLETEIEFALPRSSHVKIEVYNVIGQKIRTLVNEHLSVGRKVITWFGNDDSGDAVASGIYFYKMTADEFSSTRKMILLK